MKTLNAAEFPLLGKRLIEASAGTGKTYTIASLYLRLLTGDHDLGKLPVDKILVVTFTRAATEELRGRIRDRIRDLYEDLLRVELAEENALAVDIDEYTQLLFDRFYQQENGTRHNLKNWLKSNLAQMDEASVFTIHGFCQRILKQFAFDSGVAFESEMILDAQDYLRKAAQDYWRELAYPMNMEQAGILRELISGPEDVFYRVRSWLQQGNVKLLPAVTGAADATQSPSFNELWQQTKQCYEQARDAWSAVDAADIISLIETSGVDKRSFSKTTRPKRVHAAKRFFSHSTFSGALPKDVAELSQENLLVKTKKGEAPQHTVFEVIERLQVQFEKLTNSLPHHMFKVVKEKFWTALEQAGLMNPDDLLRLLANALKGGHGEELALHIRQQYPVAMIDEFQDTDSLQYQIFNQVYAPQESSGLYMIGDPKQAIYSFRGADIFTYLQASQQLESDQRFTLNTNWRSHSELVNATNALFQAHTSPFVLPGKIEFSAVEAAGKVDHNYFGLNASAGTGSDASSDIGSEMTPVAPLQLLYNPEGCNRDSARHNAAELCADNIQALLQKGCFNGEYSSNAVSSGDIAVLVRNRKQAQLIKEQLKRRNINSVFLSRDSVLESTEARDLLRWLQAIAEPQNERLLRSALACESLDYSAGYLASLLDDEVIWERELEQLHELRRTYSHYGVMAFVMAWLNSSPAASSSNSADSSFYPAMAVRLRQQLDGERALTNFLHLGEMLQQASRELGLRFGSDSAAGHGLSMLLRWFNERVQDAALNQTDEQQVRLESDANLVQIVTIHKSKGLQYPIVFLPFCWDENNSRVNKQALYHSEQEGRSWLNIDTQPDSDAKAKHVAEVQAESMRLLYVALTRAEQACFVQIENIEKVLKNSIKCLLKDSALGYLLDMTDFSVEALKERFSEHLDAGRLSINSYEEWSSQLQQSPSFALAEEPIQEALAAATFTGKLWDNWRLTSYSQLAKTESHESAVPNMAEVNQISNNEVLVDVLSDQHLDWDANDSSQSLNEDVIENDPLALNAFNFPKGATPGSCLHGILENWDFESEQELKEQIERQLPFYGIDLEWHDMLFEWMQQVVNQQLDQHESDSFKLSDIKPHHKLVEMEFYVPMGEIRATGVAPLLQGRRLAFDPMRGHLKGFIDLIFRHDGKYYVADYKSNYLGDSLNDYQSAQLLEAMEHHNYDLQYWIYSIAVDRYLSQRIPNYDYEQHFGGVYYFFLRGMNGRDNGQGVYFTRPEYSELQKWKAWLLAEDIQINEDRSSMPSAPQSAPGVELGNGSDGELAQGQLGLWD